MANELFEEHEVTVIDKDPEACSRLAEIDVRILQGNAANARLIEAGVKRADMVLTVTGNDEVNALACITAANMGVALTIAESRCPETIVKEKS